MKKENKIVYHTKEDYLKHVIALKRKIDALNQRINNKNSFQRFVDNKVTYLNAFIVPIFVHCIIACILMIITPIEEYISFALFWLIISSGVCILVITLILFWLFKWNPEFRYEKVKQESLKSYFDCRKLQLSKKESNGSTNNVDSLSIYFDRYGKIDQWLIEIKLSSSILIQPLSSSFILSSDNKDILTLNNNIKFIGKDVFYLASNIDFFQKSLLTQ